MCHSAAELKKERGFCIPLRSGINSWLPKLFQGLGATDCFREPPESLLRASWRSSRESSLESFLESFLKSFLKSVLENFPEYFQRNPYLGSRAGVMDKRGFGAMVAPVVLPRTILYCNT